MPKKDRSFLHSGSHPFSVNLALRSVEILMLCDTYMVSYHLDAMVYVVSGLTYEFPFWRKLTSWQRVGTGGDVHSGKYSATTASA